MQSFHGPVGYQPSATSPTSVYPNTEYAYSGIQLMHPAQTPSQANATVGNPSVGYYQPSHSAMTDAGSMISGAGSSSTNVSHVARQVIAYIDHGYFLSLPLAFSDNRSHPFTVNKKESAATPGRGSQHCSSSATRVYGLLITSFCCTRTHLSSCKTILSLQCMPIRYLVRSVPP